jgi:hypothetical protein
MEFKELKLTDQNLFEQFIRFNEYHLSTYHFSNIFIWRKIFRIFYTILDEYLCLFFKDKRGCFMYLPPLGRKLSLSVVNNCFEIMDGFNTNKKISRIENVEEDNLDIYQRCGYAYSAKPGDYLYNREDIAFLRGNRFKSKRAAYNYFAKHYCFESGSYLKQYKAACLLLFQNWAKRRKDKFADPVYRGMLEDSFSCHKLALENCLQLGLTGYVIRIKDGVAGYTFGFPINSDTFCILFEICPIRVFLNLSFPISVDNCLNINISILWMIPALQICAG